MMVRPAELMHLVKEVEPQGELAVLAVEPEEFVRTPVGLAVGLVVQLVVWEMD